MKIKKKKHPFAALFMAAAIIAAVPLGINSSLSEMREEAFDSYYYDQGGYAIYEGLEKRQAAASDLATLAKRYTDKEPSLEALADDLEYQVRCAEMAVFDGEETGFADTVRANQALDSSAQALADALEQVDLAEKDKKYPAQIIANMRSEQDKINRSSYNDKARAFNAELDAWYKPIAFQKPLAYFDQDGPVSAELAEAADTGVPSPPEAPQAPDYEDLMEQVEDFAEDTADRAGELAGGAAEWATDWADDLSDSIVDRVEQALGS
jgi:hypothetical protein